MKGGDMNLCVLKWKDPEDLLLDKKNKMHKSGCGMLSSV